MLRALIVDDELKSREVIKSLLENFCPNVEVLGTADDIESSIHAIKTLNPDLVFLDISLKEGDSFQILKAFDEINFDIIFVTAYDEYTVKALQYSGITCLFKPLDIEELQHAINEVENRSLNMNIAYQMANGMLQSKFTKIPVITSSGIQFQPVENIAFVLKSTNGSVLHFLNGESIPSGRSIDTIQDVILNHSFKKLSANVLVNAKHLDPSKSTEQTLVYHNGLKIKLDKL